MGNRATANTIPMASQEIPTVNKEIHIKTRATLMAISSNPPTAAGHKLNRKEAATTPHKMRNKEAADMVSKTRDLGIFTELTLYRNGEHERQRS